MSSDKIVFAVICWAYSLIFWLIALWAFKRKDPMHFWSGSRVRPEEITDIPSYNRENGIMWAIYAVCAVMAGLVSLFSAKAGFILLMIICIPGIAVLIFVYNRIYNRYRSTVVIYKTDNSESKMRKTAVIVTLAISAMIIILVVAFLFPYGDRDPEVNILDDRIQIKSMYGLDVYFSEIADISLIEKSMSDIGTGKRTNGYAGFGGALKGNFKSDTLGETLLFVQSKSSPTIKIERTDKKDIYISFRSSERTEQLYRELTATVLGDK